MGKTLVICDTQSLAEDVSRALGGRFVREPTHLEGPGLVLAWLDGPLAGLADPEVYDAALATWRIEDLPIAPEPFQVVARAERETAKEQLKAIRALVRRRDVDGLVNACALGREGELAFAYVRELVGAADLPVERAWLSSMARPAIREAFARLRPARELQPLADAARSRAEADWLVGVNGTRAATVRARALGGRVTLGRVLTPTLAELVRRERAIEAFEPVASDVVDAAFEPGSGNSRFRGRWIRGNGAGSEEVAARLQGVRGHVWRIRARSECRRALHLYDLTALQRDALRLHGLSAQRTEDAAQACFEQAVLSHPRSSSQYLPRELAELREIVMHVGRAATAYREPAALVQAIDELPLERVVDDAQVGDQHALIPTNAPHALTALGDDARRIYDMVARRFLAAFLPPVELEHTIVLTRIEGQRFYAHGQVVRQTGWYAAYEGVPPGGGLEAADPPGQELPELREGEEVGCVRVEGSRRESSPPARLDDVTLLAALCGAADAATIERLIELGYVVRDGGGLRPTARGVQVVDLLGEHALTSLEPLRAFERRLLAIEGGEESREACVCDAALVAGELVAYLRDLPAERTAFPRRDLAIACPRCCEGTLIENRKGYGCSTWTSREEPGCGFVIWKTIAGRAIDEEIVRELVAKGRTRELTGFRSRAGRPFRASLVLAPADEQPVTFAFGPTGRTRA